LNAAKEKLEIVSGAASPPFRIFALLRLSTSDGQAGGFPRPALFFLRKGPGGNAFGLIQVFCIIMKKIYLSS
jgi:hypothetical protein